MDDRFNTIAGWVLFAGIVALGSSLVAGEIYHSGRPDNMGYPIAGVEVEGEGDAEQPIAFFLASADPANGEQVFKKCVACHNADPGGPNALGPGLYGVMGNPIASHPGFAFSDALKSKGGTWTWESMSEWLKNPRSFVPNNKMTFAGLGDPQDRADVMAFLNSRDPSPMPLPEPPAAAEAEAPPGGAAADGDSAQEAKEQPVLESPANDPKGGGPAARQD